MAGHKQSPPAIIASSQESCLCASLHLRRVRSVTSKPARSGCAAPGRALRFCIDQMFSSLADARAASVFCQAGGRTGPAGVHWCCGNHPGHGRRSDCGTHLVRGILAIVRLHAVLSEFRRRVGRPPWRVQPTGWKACFGSGKRRSRRVHRSPTLRQPAVRSQTPLCAAESARTGYRARAARMGDRRGAEDRLSGTAWGHAAADGRGAQHVFPDRF